MRFGEKEIRETGLKSITKGMKLAPFSLFYLHNKLFCVIKNWEYINVLRRKYFERNSYKK